MLTALLCSNALRPAIRRHRATAMRCSSSDVWQAMKTDWQLGPYGDIQHVVSETGWAFMSDRLDTHVWCQWSFYRGGIATTLFIFICIRTGMTQVADFYYLK